MAFASLLAAAITFTATATGVEKGTPVEFFFAGRNTDRDYESMFLLDEPVTDFCKRLEKAGLPRGRPIEELSCRLWPVGCRVSLDPPMSGFVSGTPTDAGPVDFIYTGGLRTREGACLADVEMPAAVICSYSLPQSPFVFDGIFEQGTVYGRFLAVEKLEKGRRFTFTLSWDPSSSPKRLDLLVKKGETVSFVRTLKSAAQSGPVEACVGFDGNLEVEEAIAVAKALELIDSPRVRINGCSNVFYRAFLPLVKWLDRKERMQQPFEYTLDETNRLVFIDEDWSVPGDDPKLTPREISLEKAADKDTDTCFIFVRPHEKVSRIIDAVSLFKNTKVRNFYVFVR